MLIRSCDANTNVISESHVILQDIYTGHIYQVV